MMGLNLIVPLMAGVLFVGILGVTYHKGADAGYARKVAEDQAALDLKNSIIVTENEASVKTLEANDAARAQLAPIEVHEVRVEVLGPERVVEVLGPERVVTKLVHGACDMPDSDRVKLNRINVGN